MSDYLRKGDSHILKTIIRPVTTSRVTSPISYFFARTFQKNKKKCKRATLTLVSRCHLTSRLIFHIRLTHGSFFPLSLKSLVILQRRTMCISDLSTLPDTMVQMQMVSEICMTLESSEDLPNVSTKNLYQSYLNILIVVTLRQPISLKGFRI